MGTVELFHVRATLRGQYSEGRDSNAFTTRSRGSKISNSRSSIKDLAIKLDWLPPSKTQRVSLFRPVGPITQIRAVCKLVNSGEVTILPTDAVAAPYLMQ